MTELYSVTKGEGVPVLFLHGFPLDHRSLLIFDSVFAADGCWKRIYLDLPGMGQSRDMPDVDGAETVLHAIKQFVDETIGDSAFVLVGYSFGAMLARAIATEYSRQVIGMFLLCPEIIVDMGKRALPKATVLCEDKAFMKTISTGDRRAYQHTAVIRNEQNWKLFEQHILPGLQSFNPEAVKQIDSNGSISLQSSDMSSDVPTLILTARQDNMVGYEDALTILSLYPRSTFAIIDAAGHTLHLDQQELVVSMASEWATRVRYTYPEKFI